jgi:pimeloyl-ACP methyl ester carboxylesterase
MPLDLNEGESMPAERERKMNIVVVQAFPANETLSSGIIRFLSDYFQVYFINLPGFHPSVPPFCGACLDSCVQYVESKIEELGLDEYILAGISSGYLIANRICIEDGNCRAILASGPFLGIDYLKISKPKRFSYVLSLNLTRRLRLDRWLWNRSFFRKLLSNLLDKSGTVVETILGEVDPETFFSIGLELLKFKEEPSFKDIPYIVLINPGEDVIDFSKTVSSFWSGVDPDRLRVIYTRANHYPDEPTYEYFQRTFTGNEIESIFNFISYTSNDLSG